MTHRFTHWAVVNSWEVVPMSAELRLFMRGYDDSDERERDELGVQLAQELGEIADVRHAPAARPPGAKSAEALAWAQLVVALAGTLPVVVGAIQSWLDRRAGASHGRRASVKLRLGEDEIALESAPDDDQEALVRAFLERHADD